MKVVRYAANAETCSGATWTPRYWRAQAADTFVPIGPIIDTDFDLASFEIFCMIDGEQVQHYQSDDIISTRRRSSGSPARP